VDYAKLPPYVPLALVDAAQAKDLVETSVDPLSESVSPDLVRTLIVAMNSASKRMGRPAPYGDLDAEDLARSFRSDLSALRRLRLTPRGTVCARQFANQDHIAASRQPGRENAVLATLLRWIYTQQAASVPVRAVVGNFITPQKSPTVAGIRISMGELTAAAKYTATENLCSYDLTSGELRLTGYGQRCATQFGGDYANMTRADGPGDNVTFNIGENTGNIAANSRDFTMNATTNKDGIDPAAVVMLARALRQAAPILELPEDDVIEFTQLATRMEAEAASGSPDLGRLQRWGASIMGILNSPVVSGALGSVLAAYTAIILPGLPPA
jgi:hypothetical protein